jgi:hypothetical protein
MLALGAPAPRLVEIIEDGGAGPGLNVPPRATAGDLVELDNSLDDVGDNNEDAEPYAIPTRPSSNH